MRVRARTVMGLALLLASVAGAALVDGWLKAKTGRVDLDNQPTRTSIVFSLQRDQELRYRLPAVRVLRLIVNANLDADSLNRVRTAGRPLWTDLDIEIEDSDGRVLHRQTLSLRLDPTERILDPNARHYLDRALVPLAGKVRNLDLGVLDGADALSIRLGETDPAIVDLSVRLFQVNRVAERELAYLWTRMNQDRRETLARSNLFGPGLMTPEERANQLRHQWFPLPPDNSEDRLQRRLYSRDDDQADESKPEPVTANPGAAAATPWTDDLLRTFAYILPPDEPFDYPIHHIRDQSTPLRLDLRRLLPADDTHGGVELQWRLLDSNGAGISSGALDPAATPAVADWAELEGHTISELVRRYFLASARVARLELTARGCPLLVTLAVAHPNRKLQVSEAPNADGKTWFVVRRPDHRLRLSDGRAITIWRGEQPAHQDETDTVWERLEPDGVATWRTVVEPVTDQSGEGARRQRLALAFDAPELTFSLPPRPESDRLLVLRWHAPAGRMDPLEIEVDILGRLPVDRALERWTYLKRRVGLAPGGGELPVSGAAELVQAPQRHVVRIGREVGRDALKLVVRCADPAGYLSVSTEMPLTGEWRALVDLAEPSGEQMNEPDDRSAAPSIGVSPQGSGG